MADRMMALLVITREFTHEKSETHPARTLPSVLLIPITETRKDASGTETPVTMAMLGK